MAMGIINFGHEKKPRRERKQITSSELVEKMHLQRLRNDPDYADALIAKKHGVDVRTLDPLEIAKKRVLARELERDPEFAKLVKEEYLEKVQGSSAQRLQKAVNDAVFQAIKDDPALMKELANHGARQMMGISGAAVGSAQPLTCDEFIRQARGMRQFMEEFGWGPPQVNEGSKFTELIKSPLATEVVRGVFSNLPLLLGKSDTKQSDGNNDAPARTYSILTNQGQLEMNEEEYREWQKGRAIEAPRKQPFEESTGQLIRQTSEQTQTGELVKASIDYGTAPPGVDTSKPLMESPREELPEPNLGQQQEQPAEQIQPPEERTSATDEKLSSSQGETAIPPNEELPGSSQCFPQEPPLTVSVVGAGAPFLSLQEEASQPRGKPLCLVDWLDYVGGDTQAFVAALTADARVNSGSASTLFLNRCLTKSVEEIIEAYWDRADSLDADSMAVVDLMAGDLPWLQQVVNAARDAAPANGQATPAT